MLDLADVKRFAGKGAKPDIVNGIATHSEWLDRFNITGGLRLPHFMAQLGHECDGFKTLEEYASGEAYDGRADLGNTHPGDGRRFKGHGLIQCTGRANHRAFTLWVRKIIAGAPDFEAEPRRLCEFPYALLSAVWYWTTRKLNARADRDDVLGISIAINGKNKKTGQPNGLADRKARLKKAKAIWGDADPAAAFVDPPKPFQASRSLIEVVQRRLDAMGYPVGGIDGGDHGLSMTTGAVASFRHDRGLAGAGDIDVDLLADLDRAEAEGYKRPVADVRAQARPADINSAAVRESWWQRLSGRVLAIPSAIGAMLSGAWDYVPDVRDKLEPLRDFMTDVPAWVWFAAALAIGAMIWRSANRVETEAVDAHRAGRAL